MRDRLLISALAGVGFLVALGIAAVHGDLWRPRPHLPLRAAAMPLQAMAVRAVTPTTAAAAATQPQPAAPEAPASDPAADGHEGADLGPAPTYEAESAAHERAAARSDRSR